MKLLKCIFLTKYNNLAKYAKLNESYVKYRRADNYCLTIFAELEEGETEEDPFNDMLDKYKVRSTGYKKYAEVRGKRLTLFELEGAGRNGEENKKAIGTMALLVGKRVFNMQVGDFLELKVKPLPPEELKDMGAYDDLFKH